MAALATTSSLNNYPKLSISRYREQLRMTQPDSLPVSYSYRGKHYSYTIHLTTTATNYGGSRYWFSCPNCSKRVSVLYCAGNLITFAVTALVRVMAHSCNNLLTVYSVVQMP